MPVFFFDIAPEDARADDDEVARSKAAEIMSQHFHETIGAAGNQLVQPGNGKWGQHAGTEPGETAGSPDETGE